MYLRQYKADGTVFWNHVFVAALRNSEDKIINYVGIQHPLDKARRARVWVERSCSTPFFTLEYFVMKHFQKASVKRAAHAHSLGRSRTACTFFAG